MCSQVISNCRSSIIALLLASGITTSNVLADSFTLGQLIQLGRQGVVVGDKQFYGFSYVGTPAKSDSNPNPAPTADQVEVVPIISPLLGLTFTASWESAAGLNQDSVIRYYVHVLDGSPQQFIDGAGVSFNGTAPLTGPLTNAAIMETIEALDGSVLGQFTVFDDGTGAAYNRLQNSITLPTPMRDVLVIKDIMVNSSSAGGVATISFVDNTFHQIATPLPRSASAGLLLLGALAAWRCLLSALGLEPRTYGLKVRCSTN